MVPSWLTSPPSAWAPCDCCRVSRSRDFIGRSLSELGRLLEGLLQTERTAKTRGLLQSIDPRVKVVSLLAALVLTTMVHRIDVLAMLCATTLLLALASSLPMGRWLVQTWLLVPSFTALMALPAVLNVVTPGDPVWVLAHLASPLHLGAWTLPATLAVTRQGLLTVAILVLRVGVAVSWTVLLTMTTPWDRLLRALRVLGAPKGLLLILALMHRYLRLVIRQAHEMHLALVSRVIQPPSARAGQRMVGSRIGALLRRCMKLSRDVYDAMRARGYTGDIIVIQESRIGGLDWLWIAASTAFMAGVIWWSRV